MVVFGLINLLFVPEQIVLADGLYLYIKFHQFIFYVTSMLYIVLPLYFWLSYLATFMMAVAVVY